MGPASFEIAVKPATFEASTLELNPDSKFKMSEAPDLEGFAIDPKKPELNPFYPRLKHASRREGPALDFLPERARDNRIAVFRAKRSAKLWIATDGAGRAGKTGPAHWARGNTSPPRSNLGREELPDIMDHGLFGVRCEGGGRHDPELQGPGVFRRSEPSTIRPGRNPALRGGARSNDRQLEDDRPEAGTLPGDGRLPLGTEAEATTR